MHSEAVYVFRNCCVHIQFMFFTKCKKHIKSQSKFYKFVMVLLKSALLIFFRFEICSASSLNEQLKVTSFILVVKIKAINSMVSVQIANCISSIYPICSISIWRMGISGVNQMTRKMLLLLWWFVQYYF